MIKKGMKMMVDFDTELSLFTYLEFKQLVEKSRFKPNV